MFMAKISVKTLRSRTCLLMAATGFLLQNQIVSGATCASKANKDIVIVLDVGHIASQPGEQCQRLMSAPCPSGQPSARGVPEYDFNIKLAQRIKEELVGAGFNSTYVISLR
jgi:N-acetylmuramoyl-L-alanine amidase